MTSSKLHVSARVRAADEQTSARLFRRSLTACSILALVWSIAGTAPLLALGPTNSAPQFIVDRIHKGDRLPMTRTPALPHKHSFESGKKLPLGCDSAFSPVVSPELATVYGRCMS